MQECLMTVIARVLCLEYLIGSSFSGPYIKAYGARSPVSTDFFSTYAYGAFDSEDLSAQKYI